MEQGGRQVGAPAASAGAADHGHGPAASGGRPQRIRGAVRRYLRYQPRERCLADRHAGRALAVPDRCDRRAEQLQERRGQALAGAAPRARADPPDHRSDRHAAAERAGGSVAGDLSAGPGRAAGKDARRFPGALPAAGEDERPHRLQLPSPRRRRGGGIRTPLRHLHEHPQGGRAASAGADLRDRRAGRPAGAAAAVQTV